MNLRPGDKAPDLCLPCSSGETINLTDFLGRDLILFSFPAAMSASCTIEVRNFQNELSKLEANGYAVFGISPDSVEKLQEFCELEGLTFPIFSDPSKEALTSWDLMVDKVKDGKTVKGVHRAIIIIGKDGLIREVIANVDSAEISNLLKSHLNL